MAYMRGLELVCITKSRSFEIYYENGIYLDARQKEVEDLLDLCCFACGAAYYTLDGEDQIDFCPNCGHFEKQQFEHLHDLLAWVPTQNFGFLRFSGARAFAVLGKASWELRFAPSEAALRQRGETGEIHEVTA